MTIAKRTSATRKRLARLLTAAATLMGLLTCPLWTLSAWALCPNCLGLNRTLTPTLELIGAFLLLPFLVAYLVVRAIRRSCRDLPRHG